MKDNVKTAHDAVIDDAMAEVTDAFRMYTETLSGYKVTDDECDDFRTLVRNILIKYHML